VENKRMLAGCVG